MAKNVPQDHLSFDVTHFVNKLVSQNDAFAGFSIGTPRREDIERRVYLQGLNAGSEPSLKITTVNVTETVPEPTTIFGSALALGVGGWLKRKKSAPQNKAKSQG